MSRLQNKDHRLTLYLFSVASAVERASGQLWIDWVSPCPVPSSLARSRPLKVWLRVILLADTATVVTSQQDVASCLKGLIISRPN